MYIYEIYIYMLFLLYDNFNIFYILLDDIILKII